MFSHGKHLQHVQATWPSRDGSNRLGCNISCQKVSRQGTWGSKQGDPLWLRHPEETSPEVQNRGISPPPLHKRNDSLQIFFLKKIYRPPSAAIFFLTYFTGSATGILCNYLNRKLETKRPLDIDQFSKHMNRPLNRLFDLSRHLIEVLWFSAWWIDYLRAQYIYSVHHLSCYSNISAPVRARDSHSSKSMELSLNSAFFCQIDSISSIWQKQSCMLMHGTSDCLRHRWYRNSVAYLGEHQTYNLRTWVQLPSKFWSVVKSFY